MSVDLGPYGSGYLGHWQTNTPVLSPQADLLAALASPVGVYLAGDSITAAHWVDIGAYLTARGYPTGVRARPGAPMSDGVGWLVDAHRGGSGLPPTVVLAMGVNDIMDFPACYGQLDRLVADVGETRRLYLVAPFAARANPAEFFPHDQRNSGRIVTREYSLERANPNVTVVDWWSRVGDNPLSNIRGWLLDGVHPNGTGLSVWMSLIGNALDANGVGTLPDGDPHG
jgi:lysophospholipase L1-like esterase